MDIIIRQARKEEASQIAELFMLAWPVDEILESNGLTCEQLNESITLIAASEETIYSYENTLVAEIDGKVVGAMCAYDGADYQRLKQPIVDVLGSDCGFAKMKETEAGEFYLDSVGVLPEYRGRGIASRIIEAQCERAASLGQKVAGLIVDIDKPQVEALYSRLGFTYLDDKDFFGHTMKHMVRQLDMTGNYYRHFKGNVYRVLHIARHSETLEEMVVYQAMYGERSIWVRPKSMFEEEIERDGRLGRTIERVNLYREQERAINEEREKNRLKRQLTNNINHELKTPVASIQVCLETLLSGITLTEEKKQELIERCYTQNERLRRLLADVSLITRIEDGAVNIERETVVINDLIEDISSELTLMPEQEKLDLKVDFNETVTIHGNPSLLGSIFRNLTENAISYSEGRTIYITLIENNENYCRISFEDDGVGVEETCLPRLFERFYRVDKGRSRQKGGTGLGLSIVNSIMVARYRRTLVLKEDSALNLR